MKNKLIAAACLLILTVALSACKNNSTDVNSNTGTSLSASFFPNSDGSFYKYNISGTDSNQVSVSGTRNAWYVGTGTVGGVTYQREVDTVFTSGIPFPNVSYFNKTSAGVNFAFDTAGLSNTIPDSLLRYVSLDANLKAFDFSNSTWAVFNMNLKYGVFPIINLINVTATNVGTESVTLNLNTGTTTVTAAKIRYDMKLTIPNPSNFFSLNTSTFTAYVWIVNNIGVVKWLGNGTLLDAFTGKGIHFSDTTATFTQSLISYNIK